MVICDLQDFKPNSASQADTAAITAKNIQLAKKVLLNMSVNRTAIRVTFKLNTLITAMSRPL